MLKYCKIVPLEVTIPLKYTTMFVLAENLKKGVDAKLEEWAGSNGTTMDNLYLANKFLSLLMRVIPDPSLDPAKKWVTVCSIVDKYLDDWPQMFKAIRFRRIPGVNVDVQKRKTLAMRRDFQRMFVSLREAVSDELEIEQFAAGMIDLRALEKRLLGVENANVDDDLENAEAAETQ